MVGTGERSEKIRTYNFPEGRVTDHRIKHTSHQLANVLEGGDELDTFTERLQASERSAQLADPGDAQPDGPRQDGPRQDGPRRDGPKLDGKPDLQACTAPINPSVHRERCGVRFPGRLRHRSVLQFLATCAGARSVRPESSGSENGPAHHQ